MALPKLFQRIFWHNNTTPAIQEDNLNAMSKGLSDVDDRLIDLAGTIMEDVPQIQEALEILEPAIENIDSNVERALTAANDAEDSAETAEYWANVSNPPIPVTKNFANVITVDDAIPKAATDVKVKVEAVQDLHGYTKPWVGGAGKNKMPYIESRTGYGGLDFTLNSDGSVRVNGTPSANDVQLGTSDFELPAGTYILSTGLGTVPSTGQVQIRVGKGTGGATLIGHADKANNVTFTLTETTTIRCGYRIQNLSGTSIDVTYHGMLRLSGTSDTYEQYENICPISGFTQAKVTRTGKNLLKATVDEVKYNNGQSGWTNNSKVVNGVTMTLLADANGFVTGIKANGTASGNVAFGISFVLSKGNYIFSGSPTGGGDSTYRVDIRTTIGGSLYTYNCDTGNGSAFAINDNLTLFWNIRIASGYTANDLVFKPMIRFAADTDSNFEPYNGTDYIIHLGGTRYGATLDVDSGVMTVDTAILTAPTTTASWTTSATTGRYLISLSDGLKTSDAIVKSSHYEINSATYGVYADTNGTYLRAGFNTVDFATVSDWCDYLIAQQTAGTPVTLTYKLATPITVNLTPKEVQMLQGYNVLSANSGDVYLKYDASMIQRIANEKLDISTFKSVVASSSDFADFKTRVATL